MWSMVIVTIRSLSLLGNLWAKKPEGRMNAKAWIQQVPKIRDAKNAVLLGATKRLGVARQGASVFTLHIKRLDLGDRRMITVLGLCKSGRTRSG